eukprot:2790758-Pleurochrysis_carterae.AAC.1
MRMRVSASSDVTCLPALRECGSIACCYAHACVGVFRRDMSFPLYVSAAQPPVAMRMRVSASSD